MYVEKYSKNALFLLFLIFFIAILSINRINAADILKNITTDTNTDNKINIDNDVNNAVFETWNINIVENMNICFRGGESLVDVSIWDNFIVLIEYGQNKFLIKEIFFN